LYSSCVDETQIDNEGIKPILSIIQNEFGGWPILEGASWNPSTFNISNVLLKLRQYNYVVIYNINTDIDEKNSSLTDVIVKKNKNDLEQIRLYDDFRLVKVHSDCHNDNIMKMKRIQLLPIVILFKI